MAVAVVLLQWNWNNGRHPLDRLYYPSDTALWMVTHTMFAWEGSDHFSSEPVAGVYADELPVFAEEVLLDALDYYESGGTADGYEAVAKLRANLVILLAETGRWDEAREELDALDSLPDAGVFTGAARSLYRSGSHPGDTELGAVRSDAWHLLGETWAQWRFETRLDPETSGWIMDWVRSTGAAKWTRSIFVDRMVFALQFAGFLCVLGVLAPSHRKALGLAPAINPLDFTEMVGIFLRGTVWGFAAAMVIPWVPLVGPFAMYSYSLIMFLPAAWLLWRRHSSESPHFARAFLGIPRECGAWAGVLIAGLFMFSVQWFLLEWVARGAEHLGPAMHWAEFVRENELFTPWPEKIFPLLNTVLWAPLVEEVMFRRLLFGALRQRMAWLPSAALSSLLFAALHFYSFSGFTAIFAFGLGQCAAYSLSRSLLPCIIAHCLVNLFLTSGMIAFYS